MHSLKEPEAGGAEAIAVEKWSPYSAARFFGGYISGKWQIYATNNLPDYKIGDDRPAGTIRSPADWWLGPCF